MSTPRTRRLAFTLLTLATLALPGRLSADLVWTPNKGWTIEGGVLDTISGTDGNNAKSLMDKARLAEEDGSKRKAISAYNKVGKKYPNSVYAPEAFYRSGKLYLDRKQYFKSFDNLQSAISRYPSTPRFNEVIGEQYRIASALMDGARNRIWGWLPGFVNREKAVQYFEFINFNAPFSDYAPLALLNVAQGHQKLGNTPEAIDALDRMINNHPSSLLTPEAYLKLGNAHASLVEGPNYDQAATLDAITHYEDYLILFPTDNQVAAAEKGLAEMKTIRARSKMVMADFYFKKRNNFKAARILYNEAITIYPDSPIAEEAKRNIADVDAAEKKPIRKRFLGIF